MNSPASNLDEKTVEGFGNEWATLDQKRISESELRTHFEGYFSEFPWVQLPPGAVGFDLGCGSGRWANFAAERVGQLHCIDASREALDVARRNCAGRSNCVFHHASVDAIPLANDSMDFGYSLGVLHHVPDTTAGLASCVSKLKRGAPFLLYLYYAFDNRPAWFRSVWKVSDVARRAVSKLPFRVRYGVTQAIAAGVYLPLAKTSALLEAAGLDVRHLPLAAYRHASFYVMRTDAHDRFGTQLEQRFTRDQIRKMMEDAGLEQIRFRDDTPYWCAVGFKR